MNRRRHTRSLLFAREALEGTRLGVAAWVLFPLLLSILLYLNTLSNGFTYDDFRSVVDNPCVRGETTLLETLSRDVWCLEGAGATGSWRPLTVLALRVVHAHAGLSAAVFHGLSILLYGLVTVLVFVLVRRLTGRGRAAFLASLLFAAHPVHTEAVASISALGDLLAALLGLGALYIAAGLIERPQEGWRRVAAMLLIWVAVLTKESALTLFGVLVLLEAWRVHAPARRFFYKTRSSSRAPLLAWGLSLVLLGVYLLLRYGLFGGLSPVLHPDDNPLVTLTGLTRAATALAALGEYLRLLVFPLSLSVDYGANQIPVRASLTDLAVLWPLGTLILSLLVATVCLGRRVLIPAFAVGLVWITLSLASNLLVLIPTLVAERLLLMPSVGFCLLLGWALDHGIPETGRWPRWLILGIVTLLVASMCWRVVTRNLDWYDNRTLFHSSSQATPNSRKLRINAGFAWRNEGGWKEALRHYRRADTIAPARRDAFLERELGLCYHGLGNFTQASFHYERALQRVPGEENLAALMTDAQARRIPPELNRVPRDFLPPVSLLDPATMDAILTPAVLGGGSEAPP